MLSRAVDAFDENETYFFGANASALDGDGRASVKIDVPSDAYLLDILADDAVTIWICGRDRTLRRGNAKAGSTIIPCKCEDEPNFSTIARFEDTIYLPSYASPRGLFDCNGFGIHPVRTGLKLELKDVHTVDAVEGALWVIGSRDIARFDGTTWERIPMPK